MVKHNRWMALQDKLGGLDPDECEEEKWLEEELIDPPSTSGTSHTQTAKYKGAKPERHDLFRGWQYQPKYQMSEALLKELMTHIRQWKVHKKPFQFQGMCQWKVMKKEQGRDMDKRLVCEVANELVLYIGMPFSTNLKDTKVVLWGEILPFCVSVLQMPVGGDGTGLWRTTH
ncbi:uncharacterized protein B0H18DRAFT_962542 [Fomitopsis serialis]|uniref:uncharacterized protein n=1 Tax=Fomitopsis serialis TaxID=139415 RepID=UPI002008E703|nr:uncharacterized protein B0H18DRAFT_962542 [Neoantrodia serialis]KAH9911087.1 hypothetical protein B0H18DRAFT_962542 [Neoantrodia serialis]